MPDEHDPINDDELVLRRIPNREDHIDFSQEIPIQRVAFSPKPRDMDGISVFRKLFTSPKQLAAKARSPGNCYITELLAKQIRGLGLNLIPDPQPDQLPGHSLIPELCREEYLRDKDRSKEIQTELAILASSCIVFEPEQ